MHISKIEELFFFLLKDQARERTEWREKMLLTHPEIKQIFNMRECEFERSEDEGIKTAREEYPKIYHRRLDMRKAYRGNYFHFST